MKKRISALIVIFLAICFSFAAGSFRFGKEADAAYACGAGLATPCAYTDGAVCAGGSGDVSVDFGSGGSGTDPGGADEKDDYGGEDVVDTPPTELADLQSAGPGQLNYWADTLASYDGRDFGIITPTRNQGSKNTCWAYAAVGAVETAILREGIDDSATREDLNLDELIAAYTCLNRDGEHDPLLLTTQDKYSYGTWNQGGNTVSAFNIMTQGYSLVDEQYVNMYATDSEIRSKISQSEYYVQNYENIQINKKAIKRAILKYGAVTFNYNAPSFNITKYYSSAIVSNHASLIVGWDDSIPKSDFSPNKPTTDGAWIVKNSWGPHGTDKYSDNTYCYYASYELPMNGIYAVDMAMRSDYTNIYHYDGNSQQSLRNYAAEKQAAIYEAKMSGPTKKERLKAVMVATSQSDLYLDIAIYTGLTVNPGNVNDAINIPDQGDPAEELSLHMDGAGMHTIDLPEPIELDQGEYFSIVVSCKSKFGTAVPIPCTDDDLDSVNDMTYYYYGGKWTSYKRSNNYANTSYDNMSAKIRAITDTVDRGEDLGKDIGLARVEVPDRLWFYVKGARRIPQLNVTLDGTTLESGRDYTAEVTGDDKPGLATVTLTGTGEYRGTRTVLFEIAKALDPPGAMSGTVDVYNDTVYLHDIPIPVDWEWVDPDRKLAPGKSDFQVSLKYVGDDIGFYQKTTCDFYVNKLETDPPADREISDAEVEIEGTYTYNGSPIVPSIKVTYGGTELREGVDYVATFRDNTNAGTATAVIEGRGRYAGSISREFTIGKAPWPNVRPAASIEIGRKVSGLDDVALGAEGWEWQTHGLAIEGDEFVAVAVYTGDDAGNYVNTRCEVTIVRVAHVDIASIAELRLDPTPLVYDGSAKTPDVIATDGSFVLEKGVDFEVEYRSNTDAGVAEAVIRGINDYMGSKTLTFTIEKAERAEFAVVQPGWVYGTTPEAPNVSGTVEDAEVVYSYSDADGGEFSSVRPTDAGSYIIKAEIAASRNYDAAEATSGFVVARADRPAQVPEERMTVDGSAKTLRDVELVEGWTWEEPDAPIAEGTSAAFAVFSDRKNYTNYRVRIEIVKPAAQPGPGPASGESSGEESEPGNGGGSGSESEGDTGSESGPDGALWQAIVVAACVAGVAVVAIVVVAVIIHKRRIL